MSAAQVQQILDGPGPLHRSSDSPEAFATVVHASEELEADVESENGPELPLKEFIGSIWIGDQPGVRLPVMARTAMEARESVIAEYGEGHVISLRNEEDASRPRSADSPVQP